MFSNTQQMVKATCVGCRYSFRHNFRDRLRNAGIQSEMIDQLGGWSRQSVGQGYGEGFDLSKLHEAIQLIVQYFRE